MKRLLKITFCFLLMACCFNVRLHAQQGIPKRPEPVRFVNDYANLLTVEQTSMLERTLEGLSDSTSNQMVIVIVDTLNGYDIADYATRIGQEWGVGDKDKDNGIVMVVKTKTSTSGKIFIAIGYGLEEKITDAATRMIIEHEAIPSFKENDYYQGISKSTDVLVKLASDGYSSTDYIAQAGGHEKGDTLYTILGVLIFIVLPFFLIYWISNRGGGSTGGSTGGSYRSGSYGGGSYGGGSSGGGRSFGGGSFGGGGAGGSW